MSVPAAATRSNGISPTASGVLRFLAALSLIATFVLGIVAAAMIFMSLGAKYNSSSYTEGRLFIAAIPLFAATTFIVLMHAARSGKKWAAVLGSVMFALMVAPVTFLAIRYYLFT